MYQTMVEYLLAIVPVAGGWCMDLLFGDPAWLPHPIVGFGKAISFCERRLNKGAHRMAKGLFTAIGLVVSVFVLTSLLIDMLSPMPWLCVAFQIAVVFFCLAGTTLSREVRMVFEAADRSLVDGRLQVSRIVGRDTDSLSDREVRIAALETLAENLSDGVVAPLFWYAVAGLPGMVAYKMVNTLDSMIGYRTDRYRRFGCFAARLDDVANYIPARITALLMALATRHPSKVMRFVRRYGHSHASPNSGYPEAALAGALDCRFGGPHDYFGQLFDKPFIGTNPREVSSHDMKQAIAINRRAELMAVVLTLLVSVARVTMF